MNLSACSNIMTYIHNVPYETSAEESIAACGEAGYKHLAIDICSCCRPGRKNCQMTLDNWEEYVLNWKKVGDQYGIKFTQSHCVFSRKNPITPDIFPDGELGEEMMRRSILASEMLGVKWMVVHPVDVRVDGKAYEGVNMDYNLEYYGKWNEFCKEHHVGMAIENMIKTAKNPNVWGDINLLLSLIKKLDSDNVGACLDTGHAFLSGYKPEDCVRQMASVLRATHIADNHGITDEHVVPYMGSINWAEVVHALKEIDYRYDFAFEVQHFPGPFPKELQSELVKFTYTLGQHLLAL